MSAGWDKVVKVWNLTNCKLRTNHFGHNGYLNTVTVSPDGSLCASGGKDGLAMLWDLNDGKHLYTLDSGDTIESLCFSPNRYWLCAATGPIIKIWVCLILKNIGECICLVVNQPFLTMFAHFKIVSIIPVTSDILNTLYHFGCCHLLLLVSFCKRKGCPGSVAT